MNSSEGLCWRFSFFCTFFSQFLYSDASTWTLEKSEESFYNSSLQEFQCGSDASEQA